MPKVFDLPSAIFAGLSLLFPLMAIVLLRFWGAEAAIAVLLVMLLARLLLPLLRGIPLGMSLALLPVLVGVAAVAVVDEQLSIRLYPVFMNAAMFAAFGATLWSPPSMVERFARIVEPDLPASGVQYTRKVTMVWMGFFVVNGMIAFWTVMQPGWNIWALYNGFLAYLAAGCLFATEYFIRQRVRQRPAQ